MTNAIHEITEQSFDAEVLSAAVPVLVDFTATWCSPCRALAPILQKLAADAGGRLKVATVDGDENPAICARFGVRGFPTVIAFVGGKEVARHVGVTSREVLLAMIRPTSAHGEARRAPEAS